MATVGDVPRPRKRATQDETTPFLLELGVAQGSNASSGSRARRSQDETAPFPLMLEALRLRKKRGQVESSPFSRALASAVEPDLEGTPQGRARSSAPSPALPALTWRGSSASSALREYAARIASGEDLPPYSGPILASDEQPSTPAMRGAPMESEHAPRSARDALADLESTSSLRPTSSASPAKVVVGVALMLAALVASATAGDDATLRAAGQSVSAWLSGRAPTSYEPPRVPAPIIAPQTPCVTTAPASAR